MSTKSPAEQAIRDIRRKTRKQYSAEEMIRIVLDGLRGEDSIAALCRREGISEGLYYSWSKEFLEAGKKRLAGDTGRQATSGEVKDLKREMRNVIAWKLCTTMKAEDVTDTLELALKASGCDQAKVVHKPRLLSDNGSSYISGDLAEWLDDRSMEHVRSAGRAARRGFGHIFLRPRSSKRPGPLSGSVGQGDTGSGIWLVMAPAPMLCRLAALVVEGRFNQVMKRALLVTTAVAGRALLVASSVSAGGVEFSIGGDMDFQMGITDQDVDLPDRGYDFRTNTELDFDFQGETDNGLEYGAQIRLEADQDSIENADRAWTWLEGGWGRVQLGDRDGADRQMAYDAGLAQSGIGGIDGDVDDWFENVGDAVSSPEIADTSDDTKITYYTPRRAGIQLGASLTPQTDSEGLDVADDDPDLNGDQFENHIGLGINYQESFDDLEVGISLTGGFADAVGRDYENFADWAVGGYVEFMDISLGASYGDNGDTRGGDDGPVNDDFYFGVGLGYSKDAWDVSIGYLHSAFRQGDTDDEFDNFALSGGYAYGPGLYVYVDLMFVRADSAGTEDNEGSVLLLGHVIEF
jgi:transposase